MITGKASLHTLSDDEIELLALAPMIRYAHHARPPGKHKHMVAFITPCVQQFAISDVDDCL